MFLITTTGTLGTIVFNDLGERTFNHPIVDYDLQQEFEIYELTESEDIQSAIDNGYITVSNGINNITNLSNFFMQSNVYDSDGNNLIDDSEKLSGQTSSFYVDASNLTGTLPSSVIGNSPLVESVNGATGAVTLTTSNITEGSNLYHTESRVRNSITGATGITLNISNGELSVNINDNATSSTTELWSTNKIQNTFNSFSTVNLFDAYDSTGGTDLTGGWTDIPLGTQRTINPIYTHSPGSSEVTINEAGDYIILARMSAGGSNNRNTGAIRLVLDTGSGYNQIDGSLGYSYHRNTTQSNDTATSFVILNLQSGDKIKMQGQRFSGSSDLVTLAGASSLVISNNKGAKGDKGDTGSGSNILVAKDGTTVGTVSDKINFVGEGYTVTDAGNNETNVNISTTHDRVMVNSDSNAVLTSTSYVEVPDMTYTTKNIGGSGTYLINVSISRSHSASGVLTEFAIEVDGVIIKESQTRTYINEIHMIPLTAVATGISSGTVIRVLSRTASGSNTIFTRTMTIDGILDDRVAT
jgi:hypothetical protein